MTISIRFDSSYVHAKPFPTKVRDNRRRAVVFKSTYCLYKTGQRLLIDVNSRGTYQQKTHSPVTSDQSPTHRAFADVKVTGDNHVPTVAFIADHPSVCVASMEAVIAG